MRESSGDCYLFDIDVDEEERGQGVGRVAVKMVISEVEHLNVDRLGLNVFDSNAAAVVLYESLGFETVSHTDGQREIWLHLQPSC